MHSPAPKPPSPSPAGAAPETVPAVSPAGAVPVEPGLGRQAKALVALLLVCALAVLFWPRKDDRFEAPGLVDANGQSATLRPLLAPVTLVHFWATWCAPCMEEIPALQRLEGDFARYPNFRVVMVAVADSSDKVRTFLGSGGESVLYDPDWKVANRYGTDKLPETYLVVNDQIVEKFVGQTDWDNSALRQKLTARLAGGDRTGPTGS